jgi:hypothetical protein
VPLIKFATPPTSVKSQIALEPTTIHALLPTSVI